jgi:hypothetical protein
LNLTIEDVMMWSLQLAIDPSIYMFSGDGYNDPELENYLERYFGHKVALKDAGAEFLERAFRNESLAKRLPEVEKLIIRAMTTADQAIVAKGGKSAFRFGLQFESLGKALGQEEFWSNSALEMFRDPLVLFVLDQRFIPEDFSHFFKPGARFSPVQKFLKDYEQSSLRPLYVEVYQSKKLAAIFPNLAPVLEAQQSSSPLENGETLQIKSASSSVFPEQNSAYPLPAKWYGNAKTVDDIKALWKGRTDREWVAVGVSEDVLRGVSHRVYFRIGEQQYTLSGFLRSLRLEGEFQQNRIRDGGGSFLITGVDTVKLRVQVHKALSVLARTLRSDANFDGAYEIKVTALKVEPYFPGTINTMRISFIPREHELSLEKLYASTNWMVKLRSLTLDELKSLKEQEERIKREVKSGALVSGLHQAVDFSDRRLSLFALIDAEILIRERFYKAVQDFKTGDQQALDILVNEATYWSYAELQKLIDAANNEEKDSWQKVVGVIDQKYNKKKKQGRFAPNEASDIIAASAAVVNPAVDTKPKGGIDFNADQLNVETRNSGGEIKFQMSPQQLQELQNVPGFTPVIINVQPLNTIQMFLGLKENDENAVELSRK